MSHLREIIDFEVVKEPWNIYKLQDETILKTRFILINVVMEGIDEAKNPIYYINSDTVLGVISPDSLIGEPSEKRYTSEERVDAIEQELNFEQIHEEWNEYQLKDDVTLKVKLVLTKVARTSLRDSRGQPVYLVSNQPLTNAVIPKELREKLKSLSL